MYLNATDADVADSSDELMPLVRISTNEGRTEGKALSHFE